MSGFCPNCGKPSQDGQLFCSGCGAPLETQQPVQNNYYPQQPYAGPQYPTAPYPAPRKKATLLIALSVAFLVLAGAAVALAFVLGPFDAKPKELNGEWDCVLSVGNIFNEDTEYISEDDLGDEKDMQMSLSLDKDGEGTMAIDQAVFNAAYRGGKITAKGMLDEQLEVTLDGTLKKENDELIFTGTWKYTIVKGKGKGNVASGSWTAVLTQEENGSKPGDESSPGAVVSGLIPSAGLETPAAAITLADLEGTWKGQMVLEAIPGLDSNPNISEEGKDIMRQDIGSSSEIVFMFSNGMLWIGDEEEAPYIEASEMGPVVVSGNSFSADIVVEIGNAHVTGNLVDESGRATIICRLVFPDIPAAESETETVTVEASFTGEKQ